MWEGVAATILVVGLLYWLLAGRRTQVSFWNQALKQPDAAYDFFKATEIWRVFDDGLPGNFREHVPAKNWIGPFPMVVPKLGDRKVFVFGKKGAFRQSQDDLLRSLHGRPREAEKDQPLR